MQGDLKAFWEKQYRGMYIPMSYSVWIFIKNNSNMQGGLSPELFHLLNIITHTLNCGLIFILLFILFKNKTQAFLGSILFMLHPVQVESVAWVSEFRGLFSAFFCFLSAISIFIYINKNPVTKVRHFLLSKQFILATVLFVFALLSKPSAVVLPFVIAVLMWCFYKEKFITGLKSLSTWLLLIIPILVITNYSQPDKLMDAYIPIWQRLFLAGDSLFFYLQKILLPYPLALCYGYTPQVILSNSIIYLTTFICLALGVILFIKRKTNPYLFSAFFIILVCLSPVLGFISFNYQKHSNVADRYLYFAMLGVALLIPVISTRIKTNQFLKYPAFLLLLIYFLLNINLTSTWKSELSVWNNTLEHYPNNPKIYYNRGVQYSILKNYNAAISDYSKSLLLEKNYPDALFNRANAYENVADLDAAFNDYATLISIDSTDGSVYYKRCYLNYKAGKIKEALEDADAAARHNFPVKTKFREKLMRVLNSKF